MLQSQEKEYVAFSLFVCQQAHRLTHWVVQLTRVGTCANLQQSNMAVTDVSVSGRAMVNCLVPAVGPLYAFALRANHDIGHLSFS